MFIKQVLSKETLDKTSTMASLILLTTIIVPLSVNLNNSFFPEASAMLCVGADAGCHGGSEMGQISGPFTNFDLVKASIT